ncbi:MAG: LD-carboxypeptidase [Bacteroidota bacterium]
MGFAATQPALAIAEKQNYQSGMQSVVQPPLLKKGDRVAIIAPAFSRVDAKERVAEAVQVLRSWGLEVVLGEHLYAKHQQFAGTDADRVADLQHALDSPTIRAIFTFRGGYGMNRIIDGIDTQGLQRSPKWVIGFSDITTLLLKLHCQANVVGIHGEMALHFGMPAYKSSVESLRQLLFRGTAQLSAPAHLQNRLGRVKAPVVGGNLTTLCSHLGTNLELDTRGKILVLEDIGEKDYAIDRMMIQLKRAGKLQHLAGLVVGYFSATTWNNVFEHKSVEAIIKAHVHEHSYPVAFGFPIGHEAPNLAFPYGAVGALCVQSQQATLLFGSNKATVN